MAGFSIPLCPECGTARVERQPDNELQCQRVDCGFKGKRPKFMTGGPGTYRSYNTHWRDPIALMPGGYDDNG